MISEISVHAARSARAPFPTPRVVRSRALGIKLLLVVGLLIGGSTSAVARTKADVPQRLRTLASRTDGVLGACIASNGVVDCVNGDRPMPMQSVMKLVVAVAVLDSVDRRAISLDQPVTLHPADVSVFVQPIAKLIGPDGYRTTVRDLVVRAVIDSDSTAVDWLIARLGGPAAVQTILRRKGVADVRFDRDERRLQTDVVGLTWRPEYSSPAVLDQAIEAVSSDARDKAYSAYQRDRRDTATPRGMTTLLSRLVSGSLLSPASTKFLIETMGQTRTFPGRLKAGIPPGWRIAHKTGTSGDWRGVNAITNDVGILTAPTGRIVVVSAFLANSSRRDTARDIVLADVARIATDQGIQSP